MNRVKDPGGNSLFLDNNIKKKIQDFALTTSNLLKAI